jgi:DNA recombination protein RmuC
MTEDTSIFVLKILRLNFLIKWYNEPMTQDSVLIFVILAILLLAGNGFLIWFILRRPRVEERPREDVGLKLILEQLNEISRTVDQKMGETSRQMNESVRHQFTESAKLIQDVTRGLTRLDETNKQVVSFADQLQSLQDILKNPKQRGILGEYYLETLLKNTLPPGSYEMQYKLGQNEDGDDLIPDAVVFVKDKIIPVDSKFSLENYNKLVEEKDPLEKARLEKIFVNDLKNRITETSKYIQPAKNTMDFAFMFIPHEAIYYDLLINKIGALKEDTESLIQRAASKYKVIIVSPTSFLAYLQTVLQGLKAMQIEEQAKDIVKRVGDLTLHLKKYAEQYDKLGRSIGTVVNQYVDGSKEFKKIDKDIIRLTDSSLDYNIMALEKPEIGEE